MLCAWIAVAVVWLAFPLGLGAQSDAMRPDEAEERIWAGTPFPTLVGDVSVDGFDFIEGAFKVEDGSAGISIAPLLPFDYHTVVSETRVRLAQKDGVTSVGVSMAYNPLSPRSARGRRLWNDLSDFERSQAPLNLANQYAAAREVVDSVFWAAFPEVVALRAELAELEQSLPPDAPAVVTKRRELAAARFTAEQGAIGAADGIDSQQGRAVAMRALAQALAELHGLRERIDALRAEGGSQFQRKVAEYGDDLLAPSPPVIRLSYNATLFNILKAPDTDADSDGLDDNAAFVKGHAISLSTDWRVSHNDQLAALVGLSWDRPSAEEGMDMDKSVSAALTYGRILAILDSDFAESKAYLESLFVPTVSAGVALEWTRCTETAQEGCGAEDPFRWRAAVTPFLDLRISKASQFRLGTPIVRRGLPGPAGAETNVGITTLISITVGKPS